MLTMVSIVIALLIALWLPLSTGFTSSIRTPTSRTDMQLSGSSSLALDYAIKIHPSKNDDEVLNWELYPLSNWDDDDIGEGTLALRALDDCATKQESTADVVCKLSCKWKQSTSSDNTWLINVAAVDEQEDIIPIELQCVLSRVMVQSAVSQIAKHCSTAAVLQITLPLLEGEGCKKVLLSDLPIWSCICGSSNRPSYQSNNRWLVSSEDCKGVRQLFSSLNSEYSKAEIVDMVDNEGTVLGSLPRPYVHTQNILHRGIGIVVSKDTDIIKSLKSDSNNIPEVYVHQRTSTKRIFPSLYDMFVGGVSCINEDSRLTAAREISEELGLSLALEMEATEDNKDGDSTDQVNPLSEKLFQCTICTSYNRCVVSMFTYTCDTTIEKISWQEEEVAWGDFIPYDIIEGAADMSIDRLVKLGTWPGGRDKYIAKDDKELKAFVKEWANWDFVPDGLLVWEACTSFVASQTLQWQ